MPLSDSEIEEYRNGSWELTCPKARLVNRSDGKPRTISGAGVVSLSPARYLQLKLFGFRTQRPESWFHWLSRESNVPAGTVLPERSYYDLEATDDKGREWFSERIRIDISSSPVGRYVVEATAPSITLREPWPRAAPDKQVLDLYTRSELRYPANSLTRERISVADGRRVSRRWSRDAWKFRTLKNDILLTKHSEGTRIHVRSDIIRSKFFRERIAEAFQLLLGGPISWFLAVELRKGQLLSEFRSALWHPPQARHKPPLPFDPIRDPKGQGTKVTSRYHRKLVECYLRATIDYDRRNHPLWGDLNAVYEASGGRFIDAHALALTVVIEALLARDFGGLGEPGQEFKAAVKKADRAIQRRRDISGDIRNRLRGAVKQTTAPSAMGRLRQLVDQGATTVQHARAWQKLRNVSAHTYQTHQLSSDLRPLLELNEVLLYHIVFHRVGYRGPYFDFATVGWPLRDYPGGELWPSG